MQQPSVSASDHHTTGFDWRTRLRAAGIHLVLSAVVAILAGVLVFGLWYPFPYRVLSGGTDLFRLVVSVDVVLGPLITFAIFNRAKPRKELRRDLTIVVLMQLAGLAYGLSTVYEARPVHMVYEIDRFRVVHQVDVPDELLPKTPAGIDPFPLTGPTLLAVRPFRSNAESMQMTIEALQGVPLSARPDLWQPYDAARGEILKAAKPVSELKSRFPKRAAEIDAAVQKSGKPAASVAYLPLVARKADAWTVLLDATNAQVIGYLPLDSF